ncbi:uncharacterized protein LOC108904075 [Anoplophora glabripennis]|uniref:uncharacterized protein LOC108904075 n=1 Tax=Anoplophora glabripennis TaxID=217634 RepID=UPI0008735A48|nr:uncharacterized protein LOC108904075 [Anoplophora glabripennis]
MFSLKYLGVPQALYIIYIYFTNLVSGNYYCEFGICEDDQYCCGENRCCKKTVQVWYFWAGILLIVIAFFVAIGFYIGRKKNNNGYKRVLCDEKEPVL